MAGGTVITKEEKRKLREEKEIARLEKEASRKGAAGYLYYLIFIICVVYIADEVASQIGGQMQSIIAQSLFAPVFGAEMAVARMSTLGLLSFAGLILSFLYKPLSDRYGRKPFLVINTLGMGLGLLIISVSTNIPVYIMGAITISFFIPHDMQVVYILESVPAKRRATIYAIIKSVATLGVMLIPVLRGLVMGGDVSKWRNVYAVPGIIAAAVALFAALLVHETDPFIKRRLELLRMSDAERAAAKKEKGAENAQGSFVSALKFCFGHKQLRWILIGSGFMSWGIAMTMYYETTMTYGYARPFLAQGVALSEALALAGPFVTQALFLYPIGSALFQFTQGFLADKWGRKPTTIVMSIFAVSSFVLCYYGANHGWNPLLAGFFCGAAVGSYWAAGDLVSIVCAESTPTNLRASVMSIMPLFSLLFYAIALASALISINVLGDAYTGIISLCIAVPGMLIGLTMLMLKVKETKNVDLEEITGREE